MDRYGRALVLLGALALTETWAGSHSLRHFDTSVSGPGLEQPQFHIVSYVDDQQISRFDGDRSSPMLEPRALWMERMDMEEPGYWVRNTQILTRWAHSFRQRLETLRSYYNQSAGGVHTLQHTCSCEVSPEGRFQRAFSLYAYDGREHTFLDTDTYKWTAAEPQAENSRLKWELEQTSREGYKAYLEEECVRWLKKYLEMGKEALKRADPPSARVTRHTAPNGEVTLRCRAQDFYPKDISLTWLRDGEEQLQDMEFVETRPAGDGTFQKWAAVGVASGQEGRYTCRVQHEGLSEPLTLKWEPQPSPHWSIVGVLAGVFLLTAVIAGAVIWRNQNPGRRGGAYAQAAA